ncbi:tetraspanin-36-like [Apostichopus japonicus]|uniref:tetraspanin-36-like n=1 Tax=Stichopus japonicus TaxID=307972 RepID=UPI003AB61271
MGKALNISSRFMMMIMVLIFWFASAMLMFLGIKMFTLIGSVQGAIDGKFLSVPAVVLILLSLLCLTIGILGCAGASVENRKTQAGFFIFLLLIVAIEFIGFVCCIVYKDELQSSIDSTLTKHLTEDYGNNTSITKSIDVVQIKFECCGIENYTDWENSTWVNNHNGQVPGSCCNKTGCNTTVPVPAKGDKHYTQGCSSQVFGLIHSWLAWLIALAVIFLIIELLAMTCTCIRMNHSKKVKYQTLSEETSSRGYRA